jgi:hypothetical protein
MNASAWPGLEIFNENTILSWLYSVYSVLLIIGIHSTIYNSIYEMFRCAHRAKYSDDRKAIK